METEETVHLFQLNRNTSHINNSTNSDNSFGLLTNGSINVSSSCDPTVSISSENGLSQNNLLTLFGGNQENVNYFVGLFDYFNKQRNNLSSASERDKNHACDPRDVNKLNHIGTWKPNSDTTTDTTTTTTTDDVIDVKCSSGFDFGLGLGDGGENEAKNVDSKYINISNNKEGKVKVEEVKTGDKFDESSSCSSSTLSSKSKQSQQQRQHHDTTAAAYTTTCNHKNLNPLSSKSKGNQNNNSTSNKNFYFSCDARVFASKQTALEVKDNDRSCTDKTDDGIGAMMMMDQIESKMDDGHKSFPCGAYGCGVVLNSLASYESHYHRCHSFVCDACRRAFVSSFLLDIHLQENHDSYFSILCTRIDMYRCLVESCPLKFGSADVRKNHLMSVHKFPSSFSFHQPVKTSTSSSSTATGNKFNKGVHHNQAMDVIVGDSDNNNMSAEGHIPNEVTATTGTIERKGRDNNNSSRVPTQICFGRGSQRGFQPRGNRGRGGGRGRRGKGRNWYQTEEAMEQMQQKPEADIIGNVDMTDLEMALTS